MRAALIGAVSALALAACSDPFGEPNFSPQDIEAEQAEQALSREHIEIPDDFEFISGVMFPTGFVGKAGYDLAFDAPTALFDEPESLAAANASDESDRPFRRFQTITCDTDLLAVARERNWLTCSPKTGVKYSTNSVGTSTPTRGLAENAIVLVEGNDKTSVFVVIAGS